MTHYMESTFFQETDEIISSWKKIYNGEFEATK